MMINGKVYVKLSFLSSFFWWAFRDNNETFDWGNEIESKTRCFGSNITIDSGVLDYLCLNKPISTRLRNSLGLYPSQPKHIRVIFLMNLPFKSPEQRRSRSVCYLESNEMILRVNKLWNNKKPNWGREKKTIAGGLCSALLSSKSYTALNISI